jgi:hypothetical protein
MGSGGTLLMLALDGCLSPNVRDDGVHCVEGKVGSRGGLDVERKISLPLPRIKVNTFDTAYI